MSGGSLSRLNPLSGSPSGITYAPPAQPSETHPAVNGHLSPPSPHPAITSISPSDSESALSEAVEDPIPLPSDPYLDTSAAGIKHETYEEGAESPPSPDAYGSENQSDNDPLPPLSNKESSRDARSSSAESPVPRKRKFGNEEDQFMLNDPALYGLRRSGRPRQTLQMNETDSDAEDSDSDIRRGPPRKRRKPVPSISVNGQTPSGQSLSESDSDVDIYGGSRRAANKKKANRHLQRVTRDTTPAHGEVRFSTRKAAKVSNYNEDEDDLDESFLEPQSWIYVDEDNSPAIDVILNHRRIESTDPDKADPERIDFEYHIKWQGKAHIHATWENLDNLTGRRGYRRLENYHRKVIQEDIYITQGRDVAPEEKEKWNLDRERTLEALNEYVQAERIISHRKNEEDGASEYYVKWKGLFYDSCTWEHEDLVSGKFQHQIDRYLSRTSSSLQSDRLESNPKTRREYKSFREQPSYIKNGQLRTFQIEGVNFLAFNWCQSKNVVLADEMGLGKTVQTVAFMNWLRHDRGQQGPFIVIVPLSTLPSWAETIDNWTPDINYVVYNGNESARKIIREYELLQDGNYSRPKFNVLVTTYEYILADAPFLSQLKWQFMAVDEAHRLKNRESHLYAKLIDFKAPSRLLITGTPIQNNLGELSALMDFLMPGSVQIEENMDLASEVAAKKLAELNQQIKPFMMRRLKHEVENDLPPKTEKIIRVVLADRQMEYYKAIIGRNYAALNELGKGHRHTLLNIIMELKKASNHPLLFDSAYDTIQAEEGRESVLKGLITTSGKMMLLDQLLQKLKKDNHRVLIFSQMVKMLDILGDYFRARNYQFQRLDGTIAASARRLAIDQFNAPDSNDFAFLLSTRAGGLGINLMTADTVILFDSDWNPQADLQAMARAHRIGQTRPVSIYRFVSKDTIEEEVLERARNKLMLEFITIQRGASDKETKELTDRLVGKGSGSAEPNSAEDISRILKRRGEKMFQQDDNQRKLETLDIDDVLENAEEHQTEQPEGLRADGGEDFLKSFDNYLDVDVKSWEDILPAAELEKIKDEEKRQADERYLKEVIEQNAPRKRKADDERDERAAKKRARDIAAIDAADESDQAPGADPSRPLGEKESRNLIRAFLRYGLIDERRKELLEDARLVKRDINVVKETLDEIIHTASTLVKEEQDRVDALEKSGKTLTKKDRKAVLFDFRGVKRNNAETVVDRPDEMRILQEVVGTAPDTAKFRIPEASKPAAYTCEWTPKEDGMLLVGIVRHGFGAWALIRDDPELGLHDKLFLEEHRVEKKEERNRGDEKGVKSPGAVHLVRRTDYLLSVLKEKVSNGTNLAAKRAVENHHRNNKKGQGSSRLPDNRVSASPGPAARKGQREVDKHRHRSSTERRISHGEVNGFVPRSERPRSSNDHQIARNHASPQRASRPEDQHESKTVNKLMWKLFRPVRHNLRAIQHATKQHMPEKTERAATLRRELLTIGALVQSLSEDEGGDLDNGFWDFVVDFWPNPGTPGSRIKSMYQRLAAGERTTQQNGASHDSEAVPRVSSGGEAVPARDDAEATGE